MKPGSSTFLPPPPQQIYEYLNGHIIGHYVMKKALSVAIYNHYCNATFSRTGSKASVCHNNPKDVLLEDTKDFFDRTDGSKMGRILDHNSPEADLEEEDIDVSPHYMTPVVTRVIIEASSHRVHLRQPNTLTFDSTGSSKPVNAISSTIAQFFDVPFVRCDCSNLTPVNPVKELEQMDKSPIRHSRLDLVRRHQDAGRRGSLTQLLSGYTATTETINSVISKLYRKADFDLTRAGRGIVFLDGMDKIGSNGTNATKAANKQVLQEILKIIDGSTVDVTRAGSTDNEELDTSNLFFVCFGVFDDESKYNSMGSRLRLGAQKSSGDNPLKHNHDGSSDSGNGSGDTSEKHRRDSSTISMDTLCTRYSDDSEGYSSEEDDSFKGLKENKLAKQLVLDAKNSPIPHYQTMWGMDDVELKFTPEALEVIANQAMAQQAGRDGVENILEKLFLTIKFDILGSDVVAVEITEEAVIGKERPIYHKKRPEKRRKISKKSVPNLYSIREENPTSSTSQNHKNNNSFTTLLTDYDLSIIETLEV